MLGMYVYIMFGCMYLYVCMYVCKLLLVAEDQFEGIVCEEARAIAGQLQHRAVPG